MLDSSIYPCPHPTHKVCGMVWKRDIASGSFKPSARFMNGTAAIMAGGGGWAAQGWLILLRAKLV